MTVKHKLRFHFTAKLCITLQYADGTNSKRI